MDLWDLWVVFEQGGRLNAALSCVWLAKWRLPVCLCADSNPKNQKAKTKHNVKVLTSSHR